MVKNIKIIYDNEINSISFIYTHTDIHHWGWSRKYITVWYLQQQKKAKAKQYSWPQAIMP